MHLAVSSYALFTIAPEAESILGVLAFLTTYVLGGVAGSSFCFLLTDTVTVGASTGIFGLIGESERLPCLVLTFSANEPYYSQIHCLQSALRECVFIAHQFCDA